MLTSTTRIAKSPARSGGQDALCCVWSHGGGCDARAPADVVLDAWREAMELADRADGFFHFDWDGGVWLGYGMPDGSVRGVYCAVHCAERAGRVEPEGNGGMAGAARGGGRPGQPEEDRRRLTLV